MYLRQWGTLHVIGRFAFRGDYKMFSTHIGKPIVKIMTNVAVPDHFKQVVLVQFGYVEIIDEVLMVFEKDATA